MAYSKGIMVQYGRSVNIGVSDDEIPNSDYLSDFDLSSINELIPQINELVNSDDGGMIWGQEKIMIDSSPEMSFCENSTNKQELLEVPTRSLLNLMIEIKKFKEEYQNPENLKKIISQVFNIIKADPESYKRWPQSDSDFAVMINDIFVGLVLKPEDFNLTVEEYLNELKTTFY